MNFRKLFILFSITLIVGGILARSFFSIESRYKSYKHYTPHKKTHKNQTDFSTPKQHLESVNNPTLTPTISQPSYNKNKPLKYFMISETKLCTPKFYNDCQACLNNCSEENFFLNDINQTFLNENIIYNNINPQDVYENILSIKEKIIQKYSQDSEELTGFYEKLKNNDNQIMCYTSEDFCDINKNIFELSESEKVSLLDSNLFIDLTVNEDQIMDDIGEAFKRFQENQLELIPDSNSSYSFDEATEGQEIAMNERIERNNEIQETNIFIPNLTTNYNETKPE